LSVANDTEGAGRILTGPDDAGTKMRTAYARVPNQAVAVKLQERRPKNGSRSHYQAIAPAERSPGRHRHRTISDVRQQEDLALRDGKADPIVSTGATAKPQGPALEADVQRVPAWSIIRSTIWVGWDFAHVTGIRPRVTKQSETQ
jgi:hypothetical protein